MSRLARWFPLLIAAGAGCAAGDSGTDAAGGAAATTDTTAATSGSGGSGGASDSSASTSSAGGAPSACGDGSIDPGEDCDGAALGDGTCVSLGFVTGTLACSSDCTFDTSACSSCHDGQIEPQNGEDCDFDALGHPLILASCESLGFVSAVNPACTDACQYDTTPCLCGNGAIDGTEDCDGDDFGDLTCETFGYLGGKLACTLDCTLLTDGCNLCGNGVLDAGEECDGASFGGHTCETEGFASGDLTCTPDCKRSTDSCSHCGDGALDPGEVCDGASLGGHTCQSEGFTAGALSCDDQCDLDASGCTTCGNGVLEAGEQCDDGNVASGDGCSSACATEAVCDPDGVYTIVGNPATYSCCAGLVSVNVSSFIFSSDGASIQSSPSNPTTMSGAATTCPSGSFSATGAIAGGCTEKYSVTGTFNGPDSWTGTYSLTFMGAQCSCLNGQLGAPCVNHVFPISAHR